MQDTPTAPDPHRPHNTCSLIGPVALIVQALMAVLVVGSLLVKRWYEGRGGRKRRGWRVWAGDVGKQLLGQAAVHGSNLLVSRPSRGAERRRREYRAERPERPKGARIPSSEARLPVPQARIPRARRRAREITCLVERSEHTSAAGPRPS